MSGEAKASLQALENILDWIDLVDDGNGSELS